MAARSLIALTALIACAAAASGRADERRVREIWVPHEEFLKLTESSPDGVVMDLDEYRALVEKAYSQPEPPPPPEPPPIEAVITRARHDGRLEGSTARFVATLDIDVAVDGWVRCPLHPIPDDVGAVQVDDQPGWLVVSGMRSPFVFPVRHVVRPGDSLWQIAKRYWGRGSLSEHLVALTGSERIQPGQVIVIPAPPDGSVPAEEAFLLLRGKGRHVARIEYSVSAFESDDRLVVESKVPRAESASVTLVVPGTATAEASPPFLTEDGADGGGTRLTVALGTASSFRIAWRARRGLGESDSLLAAQHAVSLLPSIDAPRFVQETTVSIARKRTDVFELVEPAGCRFVEVEGDRVHSWTRVEGGARVLLAEPVLGDVSVRVSGVLEGESLDGGSRYTVGSPALRGSYSDRATVTVLDPGDTRLDVETTGSLGEIAPSEASVPALPPFEAARSWESPTPDGTVTITARAEPTAFETRLAAMVRVLDGGVHFDGVYRFSVTSGRIYSLELRLPAPWRLSRLEAVSAGAKAGAFDTRAVRHDVVDTPAGRVVEITLDEAVRDGSPLELRLGLDDGGGAIDPSWETRDISLPVPEPVGARRFRADLALALADSMVATIPAQARWSAVDPSALETLGLASGELVAGLSATRLASEPELPPVTATLRHRPAQGEYQAVTYVLVLEDRVRVRSELRVAVVDRAIEEIRLRIPVATTIAAPVLGEGVEEAPAEPAEGVGSVRVARFGKPWVGARELRVEYEALPSDLPTIADAANRVRVPWIEIEEGGLAPAEQRFRGDRAVVFQSEGAVRLDVDPGDELLVVPVDQLPELGEAWPQGRTLFAFRSRARSGSALPAGARPASLGTAVFSRADLLDAVVRELRLTTALGADGLSRTRAELLVAYDRSRQRIDVRLPPDARLLAARIHGAPTLSVRRLEPSGLWLVPLPQSSYARVELTWERGSPETALGRWGEWSEDAPAFGAVPVLSTSWRVYHPAGWRMYLVGDDLVATTPTAEERARSFLHGFFGNLLRGRAPHWSLFETEGPARPLAALELPDDTLAQQGQMAATEAQQEVRQVESLRPVQSTLEPDDSGRQRDPDLLPPLAEGFLVEASKLGGDARMRLTYRQLDWWRFSARTVFLLTVAAGVVLALAARRRVFYLVVAEGLAVVAAVSDLASWTLGWESPFLVTPLCEALFSLLAVALLAELISAAVALVRGKRRRRSLVLPALVALLAATVASSSARGQEGVLIPYETPEEVNGQGAHSAYVPEKTFRDLWRRAHPEEPLPETPAPVDLIASNGDYRLEVVDGTWRLSGSIDLRILTDDWTRLVLTVDETLLSSLRVDGVEVGVSQGESGPFIALRGAGHRRIDVELRGPVTESSGVFSVRARLPATAASRIVATLPGGARATVPAGAGSALVTRTDDSTVATVEIGRRSALTLSWSFPRIEADRTAQIESVSYSELALTLDGYAVRRLERVRASGGNVESLSYRLLGEWSVRGVESTELAEWNVESTDEGRVLRLFFSRPIEAVDLLVDGYAPLPNTEEGTQRQLAALSYPGAGRQESFVGVRHAERRRWHTEILGEERASRRDLAEAFSVDESDLPDRLYHFHDGGEGKTLGARATTGTIDLSTDAVLLVGRSETALFARTRYRVNGPGSRRQELVLPAGWEVRDVHGEGVRDWQVVDENGASRVIVELIDRAQSGSEVFLTALRRHESPPSPLAVPALRSETRAPAARSEKVTWVFAASEDLDLSEASATGVERLVIDAAPRWVNLPAGSSYRFALRSLGATPSYDVALGVGTPRSRARASITSIARPSEELILVNAHVVVRVRGGGQDRFRFRPPAGAIAADVRTTEQKSASLTPEGDLLVELISPVVGEHAFDLSWRLARATDDAPIDILPLRVLGDAGPLDDVEHHVAVLESTEAITTVESATALAPIELEALPYVPDGVASESLRHLHRATRADWSLRLRPETLRAVETASARVELAEITTRIGSDGTRRTDARYTIRNRDLQFLQVVLPEGSRLWGVTLGGRPVIASENAGTLQIPLQYMGEGDLSLEVGIVYEEPRAELPATTGALGLRSPRLLGRARGAENTSTELAVSWTLWQVELPEGYTATLSGGNMQEVTSSAGYASKVESLLEQVDRVSRILEEDASSRRGATEPKLTTRQRRRAESNLKQLQQALSDNVLDLEETLEADEADERAQNLDTAEFEQLQGWSFGLLQRGREGQRKLEGALEKTRSDDVGGKGARDQAFEDNRKFLGNAWNINPVQVEQQLQQQRAELAPRAAGQVEYRALRDPDGFRGLSGAAPAIVDSAIERAEANPVSASSLAPIETARSEQVSPALETPPGGERREALTFRREGGDAVLEIRLTSRTLWPRALSLAFGAAVVAWIALRFAMARR